MIYGDFYKKLKNYKREILQLKQTKRAATACRYYVYKVTGSYNYWIITYADGNQPIISEAIGVGGGISLSAPSSNTQYVFFFSQYSSTFVVFSTREITSITGVS